MATCCPAPFPPSELAIESTVTGDKTLVPIATPVVVLEDVPVASGDWLTSTLTVPDLDSDNCDMLTEIDYGSGYITFVNLSCGSAALQAFRTDKITSPGAVQFRVTLSQPSLSDMNARWCLARATLA